MPRQNESLAGMILEKNDNEPFYEVKNVAEEILNNLNICYKFEAWEKDVPRWANAARTAKIISDGKMIGIVTELAPGVQQGAGVRHRVGIFGINFEELVKLYKDGAAYRPIPKYPAIELDLAVLVPRKTVWEDIIKNILETESGVVQGVKLFDVYEGKGVESGKKSLAFRVIYRSDERTLKLEEAKNVEGKIIQRLAQKFGAKLRT